MGLIQCPGCKGDVSDKAIACPKCGYSIKDYVQKENCITDNNIKEPHDFQKHVRIPKKIIAAIVGAVIVCIALVIVFVNSKGNDLNVKDITINQWKLVKSDAGETYEGELKSENKSPFIAVVGKYEEEDSLPALVYMENGSGTISVYESESEDPSLKYHPIGYMKGKTLKGTDISEFNYELSDYIDLDLVETTYCNLEMEIILNKKYTGLLMADIKNEDTNEDRINISIPIIDGKRYQHFVEEVEYKTRGANIKIIPKMFCESGKLMESEYETVRELSLDKDETENAISFHGDLGIRFKNISDGIVLYSETLLSGGDGTDIDKPQYARALSKDNICDIGIYNSSKKEKFIAEPAFDIEIKGYVPITFIKSNGGKI